MLNVSHRIERQVFPLVSGALYAKGPREKQYVLAHRISNIINAEEFILRNRWGADNLWHWFIQFARLPSGGT
jgi:hypothetical protein